MLIQVRDNDIEQALKALKKKISRDGIFRYLKLCRYYEKPSIKKARKMAEARQRHHKRLKKRQRELGTSPEIPSKIGSRA
jgi:small subunit ribosomal protein S21